MARKRCKPAEIVSLLRQAEVLQGQGMSMADAVRQLGISEVDVAPEIRTRWFFSYAALAMGRVPGRGVGVVGASVSCG